jgi:hypothetical protein
MYVPIVMYLIIEYNDESRCPFIKIHRYTQTLEHAQKEVLRLWNEIEKARDPYVVLPYAIMDDSDYDFIECKSVENASTILHKSTAYMLHVPKNHTITIRNWTSMFPEKRFPSVSDELLTSSYIRECYKQGIVTIDDILRGTNFIYRIPSHRVFVISEVEALA